MDRRTFLRGTGAVLGASALGGLASACAGVDTGSAPAGSAAGSGSKPVRKVRLGFIALTDAASVIIAKELGFFAKRDLDVEVLKQASWPATRDALVNGELDGAHCLFSMPFSVATGVGGNRSRDLRVAMMLNQNGQAITLSKDFSSVGYAGLDKAKAVLEGRDAPTLAMTFPGGTHDIWLRYWLLATKADLSRVKINPVPPPQMVQNMSVGSIDGYCVGEPWNAVAVKQGIGFTHIASQDVWLHHPEKALVVNAKFASAQRETLKDVMAGVLEASKWLDEPANRAKAAETVGAAAYVNAPAEEIRGRLTGVYDLGAGLGARDFKGSQMQFFRDGQVNLPRKGHAIWFMSQYQRMGLIKEAPPLRQLADELILTDLYAEVADAANVDVPKDDMAPFEIKLDHTMFDPAKPAEEAKRL
jgi:nitrate/nitrite transport system substrate-binding protein